MFWDRSTKGFRTLAQGRQRCQGFFALVPFQLAEPNVISVPLLERSQACEAERLTQIVAVSNRT